ncbi:MFS transporter [Streptomyces heilongjiangensis]|uniref:MFS transporter n=2 Tax=Streptomyces heilongjiangensis TaxID=945052 RepID=A0ABW1B3L4_9ACTN
MSTGPGAASAPAPTTAHESPPAHGVPEAPPDTTGPRTPEATAAAAPLVLPGSPTTTPHPRPAAPPSAAPAETPTAPAPEATAASAAPAPEAPAAPAPEATAASAAPAPETSAAPAPEATAASAAPAPEAPAAPAAPAPRERASMFRSLRVRNYRLFFLGQVVSNIGTWMQRIAQDWLVLSLTGSSTAVGVTMALQFLPMLLFGLYGGVLVDRFPKRRLLFLTQTAMAVAGLALAALTLSHQVEVWHVYVAALAVGMATVVDNPARQSFVSEMVGPGQLQNAVSLNSANFQSARLVGPAVAGVLITTVGTGWAFLYNGLSFIAPVIGLLLMRTRELHPTRRAPRKKGQLREGLRHVAGRPELLWPIVLVGFIGTFGFNFPVWLSAYADDVFHSGAGSYSLFNTLMAVGSVAGALLAARRGTARMRVLIAGALAFGLLEIVAALAPTYWIFALFMVPLGMFGLTVNVTTNTAIQMATDPVMRGRVMALYMMVFLGGTPLGAPIAGWVTDAYGPRIGFLAGGVVSTIAAVTVGLVLIRSGGMRLTVGWQGRQPRLRFVPTRQATKKELVEA